MQPIMSEMKPAADYPALRIIPTDQTAENGMLWAIVIRAIIIGTKIHIMITSYAVEGYHRMVRKFTKSKSIFPTDDSIRKVIYMSVKEISKKWTMTVRDWGFAYSQFAIFFEDRFAA